MVTATLPSVLELTRQLLLGEELVRREVESRIVTDEAPLAQQKLGCVQLRQQGMPRMERDLPLLRSRVKVVCVGPSRDKAERIGRAVYAALHGRSRVVVEQPSDGSQYLIHYTQFVAGPSSGGAETEEIRDEALILELMVGTEALT